MLTLKPDLITEFLFPSFLNEEFSKIFFTEYMKLTIYTSLYHM